MSLQVNAARQTGEEKSYVIPNLIINRKQFTTGSCQDVDREQFSICLSVGSCQPWHHASYTTHNTSDCSQHKHIMHMRTWRPCTYIYTHSHTVVVMG